VKVICALLESVGVVERRRDQVFSLREVRDEAELDELLSEYEGRRKSDRERLELMMRYAQTAQCRTRYLKLYFGEESDEACGHCDNCQHSGEQVEAAPDHEERAARRLSAEEERQRLERLVASVAPRVGERAQTAEPREAPPIVHVLPFQSGQQVSHVRFGRGEVLSAEPGKVRVEFSSQGVKELDPRYLREIA
jgi:ATP-dependent DNA helicase RecQ